RADAAFNEDGGFTVEAFGRRLYPIQAGEKGYAWYRIDVAGTWGHGSMPSQSNAALRAARIVDRLGDPGPVRLVPAVERGMEEVRWADGIDQPLDGPAWSAMQGALVAADPEAVIVPFLAPWSTDAKHTARIGVPTYGFSPLRLGPGDGFLELFHGDDERVPVEGLQWGLGVLADAVARFCG